jgi:hypothetical protein
MQKLKEQLQEPKHEMELWLWMSSDDYCETCIMIVFWWWLPDHRMMFATCLYHDCVLVMATGSSYDVCYLFVSWLCFGVGYRIIVWCLILAGGLVVWTLWWWVAMRCHLIMSIWFDLFQIDSSTVTIRNSYALQL